MAKLFVECYAEMATAWAGDRLIQAAKEPSLATLTPVVIGAGSLQSAVFPGGTRFVRIQSDVISSIKFGTNPTATTDDKRMTAGQTEYFGVNAGDRVAVIANT